MSALPPKADMCGATRDVRYGPKADSCDAAKKSLFDHCIGDRDDPWRHLDAERLRRLKVNDQLELGRLPDWQVSRLGALEDAAGIDAVLRPPVETTVISGLSNASRVMSALPAKAEIHR